MLKRLIKKIPLVSQDAAMKEKIILPGLIQYNINFSCSSHLDVICDARVSYDRFVAVTLTRKQASLMHPTFLPNCIVILDRHATILDQSETKQKPMIYAIQSKGEMLVGYISKSDRILVLRYAPLSHPVRLLPIPLGYSASNLIIGRVCGFIQTF